MKERTYTVDELRRVKGIGPKAIERIQRQYDSVDMPAVKYDPKNHIKPNTLVIGDMIDRIKGLPDSSIDLIVTDPPYKITSRGNGGNSGGMFQREEVNSGLIFEHNDIDISAWIKELYRVLKEGSHCYIMTNNKNITHYLKTIDSSEFKFIKNLIWVKNNKIMGQSYMSQFEYIIMLRKGPHKVINNAGTSDVIEWDNTKTKDKNGNNIHDTEKPVGLMEILIENSSQKGDVVLDPFMGSGSTGVASVNTRRKFIGIELDEKYFEIAGERVKEAKNNMKEL